MKLPASVRRHLAAATAVPSFRPSYAAAMRGAIATVLPMAGGAMYGWHSAAFMGLAGFATALADKGGAHRTRAETMAGVAVIGAISATAGALAGNVPAIGIALMLVWGTLFTLVRIWGAPAATIGLNAIVFYIVGLAAPCGPGEALGRAGAILIGAAWAMLMSLALWPIRLYLPARRAIGQAFREVASYASDMARRAETEGEPDQANALFQADYNRTFQAIESARDVLAAIRRGRQTESLRGERLLVLLEKADRSFARLASLAELLERNRAGVDPATLAGVAASCEAIARVVENERNEPIPPAGVVPPHAAATVLLRELVRSVDEAAATALGVNDERSRGVLEEDAGRDNWLATLRAAMDWESVVLGHALRVGVAVGAAVWLTELLHVQRGYWVTFSTFVILQPFTSATLQKGLQRIGGTLVGGVLAAVAAAAIHSSNGIMVLIFVGAFVSFLLLPVNYGLYAVFMTPTFVLLAELGAHDWHLVGVRIENTILGCILGFLAARLLWPASEQMAVRDQLAAAVSALAAHVRAVMTADEAKGIAARRAAHRALQDADAALQQALSDPKANPGALEAAMALLVHARRFALAVTALAVATRGRRPLLAPVAGAVEPALEDIADAVRARRSPLAQSIPDVDGVDVGPLRRQFEAIRDAAARI